MSSSTVGMETTDPAKSMSYSKICAKVTISAGLKPAAMAEAQSSVTAAGEALGEVNNMVGEVNGLVAEAATLDNDDSKLTAVPYG